MNIDNSVSQFDILKEKMRIFLKERDWEKFHTPKNISMSIAIEAAELMELFQWTDLSDSEISMDTDLMARIKDEIADVLIYTLSLALRLELDLFDCIVEKMAKNIQRFPPQKSSLP
ncbi:MAG: nucleotide pyrophosphohydrolase [Candidatus Thorarchaeota archaeon]